MYQEDQQEKQESQKVIDIMGFEMRAEVKSCMQGHDVPGEIFCIDVCHPQDTMEIEDHPNLDVFAASSDPDTMYWHEAMKQPDANKFREAASKEVKSQMDMGVYELIKRSEVPEGERVIPSVWSMKRKRHILTSMVYKWKGRLNYDGSKQIKGKDYDSPPNNWCIGCIVVFAFDLFRSIIVESSFPLVDHRYQNVSFTFH